jgi:hypothetical protein
VGRGKSYVPWYRGVSDTTFPLPASNRRLWGRICWWVPKGVKGIRFITEIILVFPASTGGEKGTQFRIDVRSRGGSYSLKELVMDHVILRRDVGSPWIIK